MTDHLEAQNGQHLQLHTQEHTVGEKIIVAPKIRNNFLYSYQNGNLTFLYYPL